MATRTKQASFDLFGQSGPVRPVEFHEVFAKNYGEYGLHVVQERALPDARDGLKPVQRRILYTLYEGRYFSNGPHRKSAEIVGKVLGDRHPHGDGSVYDAMVRMAQPFTMRYPFIDGQGNWGASDGSPAAAYRYTEAKLTPLAEALLSEDLRKATVPMGVTYKEDPKVLEPAYLPGHLPPVINPIDGIAVGISTAVPPHNLGETLRACVAMLEAGVLEREEGETNARGKGKGKGFSTAQLMQYLPGPDYPEGGRVMVSGGGVRDYFETGRGRFLVRAEMNLEQLTPSRKALVITALPPIGRDKVITSIIDAINERKPGMEGLVAEPPLDETNEERTRIVLELKRDAKEAVVREALYRHTLLQIPVSAQLYFLFAEEAQGAATHPRQCGVVELLTYWLHHQLDVIERRLSFELGQYRSRLAVVEALILGAKHAQELVKLFQVSEGKAAAKLTIQTKYKLSEEQAEVIANMSLSQVTRPDATRYEMEHSDLETKIARHEELLASRPKRITLLKKELQETAKKFGDERRTLLDNSDLSAVNTSTSSEGEGESVTLTNKVSREPLALALYSDGTLKATPLDQFGPKAKTVKSDEGLSLLVAVPAEAFVLAATSAGKVFGLALDKLEPTSRGGKGESVLRHLKLEQGEKVVNLLPVAPSAFNSTSTEVEAVVTSTETAGAGGVETAAGRGTKPGCYLVEFSALGKVKKTPISEYRTASSAGLGSLKLSQGDSVVAALLSNGQGEYFVTTDNGQTLRFSDEKLSSQGRPGQGQNAIALDQGARVVSVNFYNPPPRVDLFNFQNLNPALESEPEAVSLLVLSRKGLVKRTLLSEYPLKGRATGGVATLSLTPGDKVVASWLSLNPEELVLIASEGGSAILLVSQLALLPRSRKGQPLPIEVVSKTSTNGTAGLNRIVALMATPDPCS